MAKSMLVNVTHVEESRVAIVEDGILSSYEIETTNRTSTRGNIYNAVVETVHASLEAAFVRIGPDLKGFLSLDEVNFNLLPARGERKGGRITQHLKAGQKLMVQSIREPFSGKPASVTTYFSLPGRYLVLMPGVDNAGVSRKIEDTQQRDRLKKLVDDLKVPEGFGLIVRTAGMEQTKTELQRDLRYLLRLWESIQRASSETEFPGLVYREADLVIRTIRDYFTQDIEEVWIDSEETFEKALAFVRDVMPTRAKILKRYDGEKPIFSRFNLEDQIERIYKRRVPLPSGGEIVIDGTEALTAVDVNSARSRRGADAEENATNTNLEAATEIARQLRLRDLGGLIVIDFIDMNMTRNKTKVEKTMRDSLKGDKARYDLTKLSKLGLMEIARQRIKGEKLAASYTTCTNCDGYGLTKTIEAASLSAFRKLQMRTSRRDLDKIQMMLPQEIGNWILNHKRDELREIERRHAVQVEILPDPALLRHECRFATFARTGAAPAPAAVSVPSPAPASLRAPAQPAAETPTRAAETRERDSGSNADRPTDSSTPSADGAVPADDSKDSADGRPRRRRRRRRGGSTSTLTTKEAPTAQPVARREPTTVPANIRSDELMPAAVGSAEGQKSPGGRRSRGGGSRTRSKRGSGTSGSQR